MKKVNIYWFSGTGNSLKLAKTMKSKFEDYYCDTRLFPMVSTDPESIDKEALTGLVFPVAVQSTYPLVWDFINNLPDTEGTEIFMADTMADASGGIVGPVKKVLSSKGYKCIGAKEFKMPSSMAFGDDEKREQKIEETLKQGEDYVTDILNGISRWDRVPIASDMMRSFSKPKLMWSTMAATLKVETEICTKCGLCLNVCPVDCIKEDDNGFPVNNPKICNSCLRCLNFCPVNAYKFIGRKFVQNREEPLNELIQRTKVIDESAEVQ